MLIYSISVKRAPAGTLFGSLGYLHRMAVRAHIAYFFTALLSSRQIISTHGRVNRNMIKNLSKKSRI